MYVAPSTSLFVVRRTRRLLLSLSLFVLHGRFCRSRGVLAKRRATRDARAAVRLHCVERYVNMSTQLGYLPFLRRQFQVNSPNWLLSMLCLRVRRYVSLYRPRSTLPRHGYTRTRVHTRTCVFGIADYIIRARCANGNEAHCSLKITNNRCSTVSTTGFINIYKSSSVRRCPRDERPDSSQLSHSWNLKFPRASNC